MFVRYFTVLESPAEAIRAALTNGGPEWMSSVALQSDDRRGELVSRVGVPLSEHHSLSKVVRVSLGTSTRLGETTVLPMSWEATGPLGLFPVMDGDLEIAPLGEERTMLAMSARYRPPLGAVGRIADRALLHRVAEATIKDFVDRVADRLMDASVLNSRAEWPVSGPECHRSMDYHEEQEAPMFGKVVLAVDASEASHRAARLVCEVASTVGSEVVAVHVRSREVAGKDASLESSRDAYDVLNQALASFVDAGVNGRGQLWPEIQGSVAARVVDVARQEDADLIVLGSCGSDSDGDRAIGEVTQRVLLTSEIPVLVVG